MAIRHSLLYSYQESNQGNFGPSQERKTIKT